MTPADREGRRLSAGDRLLQYEVLELLGVGGMGEVYRAKDARLGREVALKVLPARVADDPAVQARFEREARAVAALSHPHICALFDIGEAVASEPDSVAAGQRDARIPNPESRVPFPEPRARALPRHGASGRRDARGAPCRAEAARAGCYHEPVNDADIRAFVERDWAAIDRAKARFWAVRKHAMSASDALSVGDALRRHVKALRPDWPDAADRAADLATHARVSGALRAVTLHGPR